MESLQNKKERLLKELAEVALRTKAFNEICAWREQLGKGSWETYYHNESAKFKIEDIGNHSKVSLGFISEEAARTCLDNLSDNAKAFLKGKL